jgi:hypothetical protein
MKSLQHTRTAQCVCITVFIDTVFYALNVDKLKFSFGFYDQLYRI